MTGFGRKRFAINGIEFTIEIKTLNHKHLDIHCRLPESLTALEIPMRNIIKGHIGRGRVDVRVFAEYDRAGQIQLNQPVYQAYSKLVTDLLREHKLASFDPVALLSLPGIVTNPNADPESMADDFWPPLKEALVQLAEDRKREGAHLWQDMTNKLNRIEGLVMNLEDLAALQQQEVGERYRQRLARLDENLDDARILTEIAILVDKSDINEELVRLGAHLQEFVAAGKKSGPLGRRLEFLGQEMLREVNTVAAKSAIYEVSKLAVDIKTELEKIREQIQNVE
jgi:uncharacterized protein (TIGR00255 family)